MKLTSQIALRCSNALPLAAYPANISILNYVIDCWDAGLQPYSRKTVPVAIRICDELGV